MKVPFNDLTRIHEPIIKSSLKEFEKVVNKSAFILNEDIEKFEQEYSSFTKQKYSVSCANGTDALEIILRGLKITNGDEVILPTNSFVATALAVSRSGATPVFVDNDDFYLIKTDKLERKINKKTKAIIAVNLYGQLAELSKLRKIAKEKNIYLIEDSAQSHGAKFKEKNSGDFSIAAGYSFYPGKNLGAWGDGGIVTTNNKKLYENILLIRNWGSVKKYYHETIGFNSRLQPIQGIVLSKKLKKLSSWNEHRNFVAKKYSLELEDLSGINLPKTLENNYHVWHLYVVRIKNRDIFIEEIKKKGIELGIHYPLPIHRQKAYKDHKQYNKKIINADNHAKELVSLPIFPHMTEKEINYVISNIRELIKKETKLFTPILS